MLDESKGRHGGFGLRIGTHARGVLRMYVERKGAVENVAWRNKAYMWKWEMRNLVRIGIFGYMGGWVILVGVA